MNGLPKEATEDPVVREWQRKCSAVTIELSLNSPPIKKLGDDARHFLQTVALFPQGVDRGKLITLSRIADDNENFGMLLKAHNAA